MSKFVENKTVHNWKKITPDGIRTQSYDTLDQVWQVIDDSGSWYLTMTCDGWKVTDNILQMTSDKWNVKMTFYTWHLTLDYL